MPGFIFAKEVWAVLAEGRKVLELPLGSRITPAARDLIRDHGLEVQYVDPSAPPAQAAPIKTPVPAPTTPATDAGPVPAWDLSEAEVEAIVTRVLERFRAERPDLSHAAPAASQPTGTAGDGDDLVICRCEEITRGEIKAVIRTGLSSLSAVKRVTRAGMGLCQGQTCQRLVAQILSRELGRPLEEIEPITARAPVRPLPLSVLATG